MKKTIFSTYSNRLRANEANCTGNNVDVSEIKSHNTLCFVADGPQLLKNSLNKNERNTFYFNSFYRKLNSILQTLS